MSSVKQMNQSLTIEQVLGMSEKELGDEFKPNEKIEYSTILGQKISEIVVQLLSLKEDNDDKYNNAKIALLRKLSGLEADTKMPIVFFLDLFKQFETFADAYNFFRLRLEKNKNRPIENEELEYLIAGLCNQFKDEEKAIYHYSNINGNKYWYAQNAIGNFKMRLGKFEEAKDILRKIPKTAGKAFWFAICTLGEIAIQENDIKTAEAYLKRIPKTEYSFSYLSYLIGKTNSQLKQKHFPNISQDAGVIFEEAQYDLAVYLFNQHGPYGRIDVSGCKDMLNRVTKNCKKYYDAILMLGTIAIKESNWNDAIMYYKIGLENSSTFYISNYALCGLYVRVKNTTEALKCLMKIPVDSTDWKVSASRFKSFELLKALTNIPVDSKEWGDLASLFNT